MVNNLPVKAGDLGLIPERGRSAGGGTGNPLGKSRGQRSLMGYSPWGYKELDMTEHGWSYTHTQTVLNKNRFTFSLQS